MSKASQLAELLSDDGTVKTAPTVFNSTTLPTTGFKLGDLWYDTDDDEMSVCILVDGELQWKGV